MQEKKDIRKNVLQKRSELTNEELQQKSDAISHTFLNLPEYQNAPMIYIYMDFKNEVVTKHVIEDAFQRGKKVAIPKIIDDEMHFFYMEEGQELTEGYFGIREPNVTVPVQDSQGVMVVPGVAFEEKGYRVGYGKGYYDRFLAKNPMLKKIAFAFELQMVDEIPYDIHDIPMDIIITENRMIVM
ncbi:5-formyltetrahydrofolate cyclo-ligase [Konateibacter massiliensis]|uniref:5-formyltetrahydrofolate cyclo-ligase n=1 Tax=Konateibacter massiliensis TaxID=2002841 RepID=UPI000C1516E0|nr:5-formyltetrahydrofolate cyclo-ligase [Konateibacter massiliensis]